jgi:hypothetical protein
LNAVAPILQAAEANYTFEKQLNKANALRPNQAAQEAEAPVSVTLPPALPVGQPGQALAPIAEVKNGTNP